MIRSSFPTRLMSHWSTRRSRGLTKIRIDVSLFGLDQDCLGSGRPKHQMNSWLLLSAALSAAHTMRFAFSSLVALAIAALAVAQPTGNLSFNPDPSITHPIAERAVPVPVELQANAKRFTTGLPPL